MQEDVDVVIVCPLGMPKCVEIKGNKIHRCAWYTEMDGKDPTTNKDVKSKGCAIAYLPILSTEISQTNRGQTGAINNLETAVDKVRKTFVAIALESRQDRPLLNEPTTD